MNDVPQLLIWYSIVAVVCFTTIVVGYFLISLLHWIYFGILPELAIKQGKELKPEGLRRYLELVFATPSPLGPHHKLVVRNSLVGIYLPLGRHAEAAAHCRANLACLDRFRHVADFPALEAGIRRKLADCLEALGEQDEAEEERRRAVEALQQAPDDMLRHWEEGSFLKRANRYAEAYDAFEQALKAAPEPARRVRVECMVQLVLTAYDAGRPVDCIRWAEAAIALGAEEKFLRAAHRMASVACGNLSRFGEAEHHSRLAYEAAVTEGDQEAAGEILAQLASIQRQQGKLAEAYEAALQAETVAPKAVRMALLCQAEVLEAWGRFDEALVVLRRHRDDTKPFVIPSYERRLKAGVSLAMAGIEANAGRGDAAWTHLLQAVVEFESDAKLSLACESAAVRIQAVQGYFDTSRVDAEQAEARLAEFEHDPSICRSVLYDLGIAATIRGDYEQGENYWDRYFPLQPAPVLGPTAYYYRGECRLNRGDTKGAKTDFREAIAMNIDTHHARLAGRRLQQIGLS